MIGFSIIYMAFRQFKGHKVSLFWENKQLIKRILKINGNKINSPF